MDERDELGTDELGARPESPDIEGHMQKGSEDLEKKTDDIEARPEDDDVEAHRSLSEKSTIE